MENKLNNTQKNGRISIRENEEKEKQHTNMSFGENNLMQNTNSKEKEKINKNLVKQVTFSASEKKTEENLNNKNLAQNSSFEIEPRFGSFKKIKEILQMSKCGVQTPGQSKPNQDRLCITKNIFNDKNLENYFFAVW